MSPAELRVVAGILDMYRAGWFPMSEDVGNDAARTIQWVQPHMRGIIPLEPDRFRVARSLRARVRGGKFVITCDEAFGEVIRACASPAKGRELTWLAPQIIDAFELLHRAGIAHSIEAWLVPARAGAAEPSPSRVLVGGLYGLCLGSVFAGESMFSRPDLGGTDASKVCLVHLVRHLGRRGFTLLDSQMANEHLARFGCYEMPREEYVARLASSGGVAREWLPFEPDRTIRELSTVCA